MEKASKSKEWQVRLFLSRLSKQKVEYYRSKRHTETGIRPSTDDIIDEMIADFGTPNKQKK